MPRAPSQRREPDLSDPTLAAKRAGPVYADDSVPGIRRQRRGGGFEYVDHIGRTVRGSAVLSRIRSLAIPPAWEDVWITSNPNGHLQATGRDGRGRKQYLYHRRWRETRDETKYHNAIRFAKALPQIRRRVFRDLRRRGLPREKVLALIGRLLETTLIRVGNDEYARANGSFGLTTMRDRHIRVTGNKICFNFHGKSDIEHEIALSDRRLARVVRKCQDLPGQELFQYVDELGETRDVGSNDVNDYLREMTGQVFTAKDFRTWAGTALAAQALKEFQDFDSRAAARRNITAAIERVAARLGNTKSVCRKCYVHPAVIHAYLDRSLVATLKAKTERELRGSLHKLSAEEAAVLALLQQQMERTHRPPPRQKQTLTTFQASHDRKPPSDGREGRTRMRRAS